MRMSIENKVVVAGVGASEVSRDSGKSEGRLTLEAAMLAIADAGMTPNDIDGIVAFPDRVSTPFEGPHITYVQRALGLEVTNFWQALGFGAAQLSAIACATYAIASGAADAVLCYRGHLRQERRYYSAGAAIDGRAVGDQAFRDPYGVPAGAPRYALWAQRYMHKYGLDEQDLGAVVLVCRDHAQRNPRAVWHGSPLSMEDYLASPFVATPLRLLDCDYPVDGANALVLTSADRVADLPSPPVYINALGHATGPQADWDTWPDLSTMASAYASRQLWSRTELTPQDVSVAEVYDGFSFLALCWLEDLGFCEPGAAGAFVRSGETRLGGRLPICTDGGQLGMGRLHGFGKIVEAVLQLRGQCEERQVPDARVAVASSGGGIVASAVLLTR